MGLFDDAWDAVTETASDAWEAAADLAEDAWDAASGASEDAWEYASETAEDAWESVTDAAEDSWEAVSEFAGDAWEKISESAEDVYEAMAKFAEETWENATVLAEGLISTLERTAEEAWETVSRAVEDAWKSLTEAIDAAMDAFAGAIEAAWKKIEQGLSASWRAAVAAWEMAVAGVSSLVETTLALIEKVVMWIGDFIRNVVEAILYLGACLGGIVIYALAKLHNITVNTLLMSFPQSLPKTFRSRLSTVFGNESFDNVYYVEQAILAADWYTSDVQAMTFAAVVVAGVPINYLVFWHLGFFETDRSDRSTMVHELVHVQQLRRFGNENSFACAYGIGYRAAGYDYRANPLEDEAYSFETAKAAAIRHMM